MQSISAKSTLRSSVGFKVLDSSLSKSSHEDVLNETQAVFVFCCKGAIKQLNALIEKQKPDFEKIKTMVNEIDNEGKTPLFYAWYFSLLDSL